MIVWVVAIRKGMSDSSLSVSSGEAISFPSFGEEASCLSLTFALFFEV